MSTPMHDVPEHLMMPVNKDGHGPVNQSEMWGYRCWCNTDCGNVEHVKSNRGTNLCDDALANDMQPPTLQGEPRPGFCPLCHAYTQGLMRLLAESGAQEREGEA